MKNDIFMNSDLLRYYYYSLVPENEIDQNYEDPMYAELLKIARKELPAEMIGKGKYEYTWSDDDDFCVTGVTYDGVATVWFDGNLAEEVDDNVYEYDEEGLSPVALDVVKKGSVIIFPELVIGEKTDIKKVIELFDGNFEGRIGEVDFKTGTKLIDCAMKEFELLLKTDDGVLTMATIQAVAMR